MNELLFFDPRDAKTEFLSNLCRAEFVLEGAHWPTVEHYYQAQKFVDAAYVERMRLAATPRAAKNLGQTRDLLVRADWDSHRMTAMLRALVAKFTQHESLQQKLLETGDAILVEASPHDGFWGALRARRGFLRRLSALPSGDTWPHAVEMPISISPSRMSSVRVNI